MTTSTLKYAETWGYYAPLINSGFVLIEMFLTVRHVSNYSQKWWFSLKNSFSSGKIYLDNFIEQKDPICEVCKRRAVSALQGTFGSVDNDRPPNEGCREMASKEEMDFWRHVVDSQTKRCRNIWQRFGLVEANYRGVRFDVGERKGPFNASYIRSKQEQTSSILYPQDCAKVCQCVPMVLKCARLSMCQFAKDVKVPNWQTNSQNMASEPEQTHEEKLYKCKFNQFN